MTPERWRQVTQIYGAVVSQAPERRAAAVAELCGTDEALRREIESLLASQDGGALLEVPAADHPSVLRLLTVGSQIGVFRIEGLLGVGGMGEVYRARDTKLNREVAIKILPVAFATDPERLARFKREAQLLASLNHPNIAAIHGFEDAGGVHALVLELVEGPTLADRIASGPISIDEALPIARQTADALEAAHEQGIIHRDLKPANIKVRDDGTVKVLDFGLAKLAEPVAAASGVQLTQSPTITTPAMTAAGMILGTAAYMSPEQAKGKPADKRSDIWAFGCVLYEMLTGKRAFEGEDVGDTLASILKTEPDWTRLPADSPPSMRRLLVRALAKDKTRRTGDAASLRFDIDDARAEPAAPMVRGSTQRPFFAALLAAIVVAGLAVTWSIGNARRTPVDAPELRVDIATPDTSEPASIALSPDGTKLVYVLDGSGQTQIVLRELSSGATRVLPGTEGAVLPFWSPNSRSIAFFAEGRLKRIDLAGGPPRDLAPAPGGRLSGSWGSDGTIIFVPAGAASNLVRVSENGGAASPIVMMHGQQRLPPRGAHFLPDGRHIVFYAIGEALRGVFVGAVDGSGVRFLVNADTNAVVTQNHLLFQRGTALFAQPFDPVRQQTNGEAIQIAEPVNSTYTGVSSVSASLDGKVAFRSGGPGDRRELTWFDRAGHKLEALGEVETSRVASPNLSHDGRRLAVGRIVNREGHVWVYDLVQGGWTRTTGDGTNSQPVWSPDDRQIAHVSSLRNSASVTDLYLRSSRPGGEEQVLVRSPTLKGTTDWSNDGRYLLFNSSTPESHEEIWAYSFADQKPFPVLNQRGSDQSEAKFSPDGKWIVFQSNQSGRFQIYVQAFPSGEPIAVSTGGGAQPRWRRDGREIYYVDFEGRLNGARVEFPVKGAVPTISKPVALFRVRIPGGTLQPGGSHPAYDVTPDGERFLVNTLVSESTPSPITLILNWHPRAQTP